MSLRSLTKVYEHSLMYFPKDDSHAVVPTKNIIEAKTGEKYAIGSKVVVLYEGENWDAEICAVNGT